MISDYYGFLYTGEKDLLPNNGALASGFVDECTVQSCKEYQKQAARQCYRKSASAAIPKPDSKAESSSPEEFLKKYGLSSEFKNFSTWPLGWIGFEIPFTLQTPWYSKDDRPFHVLDNPLRKDRVFGTPFMSASSWKGMLRWAFVMGTGQIGPNPETDEKKLELYKKQVLHLFGNERGEQENFQSGVLQFYPTWFDTIDFELINPHDRARRAGINPIFYEVVPAGTKGILKLLYAPVPGEAEKDGVERVECLCALMDAILLLLGTYGISAKRTVGWGTAKIDCENSTAWIREDDEICSLMDKIPTDKDSKEYTPPKPEFKELMDEKGNPLSNLLADGVLLSKTQFKKLGDAKPRIGDSGQCTNSLYEEFYSWYKDNGPQYQESLNTKEGKNASSQIREYPWTKFTEAIKIQNARKGGEQ